MKKHLSKAAVVICLCFISSTVAQQKQNLITANPLGLLFGAVNAEYQRGVSDNAAFGVYGTYWNVPAFGINAVGAGVSMNFYTNSLFKGWFFRPGADVGSFSYSYEDEYGESIDESVVAFGMTGIGGYRWTWTTFSLALGAGASASIGEFEGINYGGFGFTAMLDMGFAF
ncbi:MAG: hypothetical protein ACLFVE_08960 [Chitinispirillaceae bacterium]